MRVCWISAAFIALTLLAGAPASAAGPALVFDASDGKVLYAEDADDQWHPASLTKIMTAYLAFEAVRNGQLKLDQRIPYSTRAAEQPPSKLGLNLTATLTVEQALKALIIKSANDVAVMLAEAVSGSQALFVARMNETARRLGMSRTQFVNANGLPAFEQVTTARDLAKLSRAVMVDFPEFASYWGLFDAHIGKIYIGTHNSLLHTFEGADGMKTGFICDSGFNMVASATRDGRHLMAVVLGESTSAKRTMRAASLLEHGFESYGWKQIFNTSVSLDSMPVASDAKAVTSVRKDVISYVCGSGPRKGGTKRIVRKKKARSTNAAAGPEGTAGPATTAAAGSGSANAANIKSAQSEGSKPQRPVKPLQASALPELPALKSKAPAVAP
jgi:D-alanyl-D-alanine carboxypeptidase